PLLEARHFRVRVVHDLLCLDGVPEQVLIANLRARELGSRVDDGYLVLVAQGEGVLDSRVAHADDHDLLVLVLAWIAQLVRDVREVSARTVEVVQVALAESQDDVLRGLAAPVPQRRDESALATLDLGDFVGRTRARLNTCCLDTVHPRLEDRLAPALLELQRMV